MWCVLWQYTAGVYIPVHMVRSSGTNLVSQTVEVWPGIGVVAMYQKQSFQLLELTFLPLLVVHTVCYSYMELFSIVFWDYIIIT